MKKQLPNFFTTLCFLMLSIASVSAQKAFVPDNNFEQALIDLAYDNVLDDSVLINNIKNVYDLNVSNKQIKDLTGIKSFTSLNTLDCSRNEIKFLDVSNMLGLRIIICNANGMNKIKLDGLSYLNELYCFANNLKVLSFKDSKGMFKLFAQYNQITSLDLRDFNLNSINCAYNKLTYLNLNNSAITGTYLTANGNPDVACITVRYVNQAWIEGGWAGKPENATYATSCSDAPVSNIADSNFEQALIDLGYDEVLDGKVLTDVIKNITSLDLSGNSNITNFAGIEAFKNLTTLNLSGTKATVINLNGKTDANINYKTADEANTGLQNLSYLNVSNSSLTQLDLRGLNALKTGTMIALNNTSLSCILVDDEAAAPSYSLWQKDAGAKYGNSCKIVTGIAEASSANVLVYPNPNSGEFNIQVNENTLLNIRDASGKLVFSQQLNAGNQAISLNGISKGLYFLELQSASGTKDQKLVLQ